MHETTPHARRTDEQAAVAGLARILLGQQDLGDVLATVARLAADTIPGADDVSVTLLKDDKAHTAAFTGPISIALDEHQYGIGHGPCLDAAQAGATIIVDIPVGDDYPDFVRQAREAGVRRTMSIGLPVPQGTLGGINIYGLREGHFPDDAIRRAQTFAAYAAVAVANAAAYADTVALARQMQQAMATRAVIEQAKGILMCDNRCTADQAFAMLAQASNHSHRKLRDIAAGIVDATAHGR